MMGLFAKKTPEPEPKPEPAPAPEPAPERETSGRWWIMSENEAGDEFDVVAKMFSKGRAAEGLRLANALWGTAIPSDPKPVPPDVSAMQSALEFQDRALSHMREICIRLIDAQKPADPPAKEEAPLPVRGAVAPDTLISEWASARAAAHPDRIADEDVIYRLKHGGNGAASSIPTH